MSPEEAARIPAIRILKFWTTYLPDPAKPGEFMPRDYVEWGKIGDSTGASTQDRVERLRKGGAIEWQIVGPAYEKWKTSQEIPITGTPLEAWPGADHGLVEALKAFNIRTVEEFVSAPSHAIDKVRVPDARRRQKMGEDFLLSQGRVSEVAAELAKRDGKIAAQEAEIAEMKEQIKMLMAGQKPEGQPVPRRKAA